MTHRITALLALNEQALSENIVVDTLGVILKYQDDIDKITKEELQGILNRVKAASNS